MQPARRLLEVRPSAFLLPPRDAAVRPWTAFDRVLAIRLDSAGDVLMTTPALRALRRVSGHLALLTSPSGAATGELLPEVDEVIVYEAPWMKAPRPDGPPVDATADLAMVDRLRAGRYDAAAIFTVNSQSPLPAALLCHFAGVGRRLGHCRENPYGLLTDWVPDPEPDAPIRHEVERQLALLAAVGIETTEDHLALHVPDVAVRRVRARVAGLGNDVGRVPWVVVQPGAPAPPRRYPPEKLGAAVRELSDRAGWPVVYTGDASEAGLVDDVRVAAGGIGVSVAGTLSFADLAALIALAPVVITNNTAPAHVAAAVGTPVVDLYALTNLQHTPWRVPSRVLAVDVPCRGCRRSVCPLGHNACLHDVEPSAIADAALELVIEQAASPAIGSGRTRVARARARTAVSA
jgi:ADP-heptose:LPS heptosyltransferase